MIFDHVNRLCDLSEPLGASRRSQGALAGIVVIALAIGWWGFAPNGRKQHAGAYAAYYRALADVQYSNNTALARELRGGLNPNAFPNKEGEDVALLCLAASNGDVGSATLLLNHGANPDIQDGRYYSPLAVAADNNHLEVMSLLIAHGATVNKQVWEKIAPGGSGVLWQAARDAKADEVSLLLQHGANPNTVVDGRPLVTLYKNEPPVQRLLRHAGALNDFKVAASRPSWLR